MATKLVDYHIHTGEPFLGQKPPHAVGKWGEYYNAARNQVLRRKGGNVELIPGNSNHTPHYFSKNGKNLYPFEIKRSVRGDKNWEKFLEVNLDYRDKHKSALLGLEVDYFEDVSFSETIEAIKYGYLNLRKNSSPVLKKKILKHLFDYVILSNHFVFGIGFDYNKEEYLRIKKITKGDVDKVVEKYWENILKITHLGKMLKEKTKIKKVILGHLDLIKVISLYENKKIDFYSKHEKIIDEILANAEKYKLAIEYNTAGIRKGVGAYPDSFILKKMKALKIENTFGSDSHSPYTKVELGKFLELTSASKRS